MLGVEEAKVTEDKTYCPSQYARIFDIANRRWSSDMERNRIYLMGWQNYFNTKLQLEKRVYLNDVYEALGFPRVDRYERRVGWFYDERNPIGDNYIDFGLNDIGRPDFDWEYTCGGKPIVLDFNVDGDIWKYL